MLLLVINYAYNALKITILLANFAPPPSTLPLKTKRLEKLPMHKTGSFSNPFVSCVALNIRSEAHAVLLITYLLQKQTRML